MPGAYRRLPDTGEGGGHLIRHDEEDVGTVAHIRFASCRQRVGKRRMGGHYEEVVLGTGAFYFYAA